MLPQIVTNQSIKELSRLYLHTFHEDIPENLNQVLAKDGLCLLSKQKDYLDGLVILTPLNNKNMSAKLVMVSCICSLNMESTSELIKEGVKIAYEMGYQLALSCDNFSLFRAVGFTESKKLFIKGESEPLLTMELAWGALGLINKEIVLTEYPKK